MKSRVLAVLASTLAVATCLAGCSGSSSTGTTSSSGASTGAGKELAGKTFVVSSKDFTESILLGKIVAKVLTAHGAKVEDKTNIKGSVNTRDALVNGQIDMYWEYTGTAWITYQKNTAPIADPNEQYAAVKKADAAQGIAWLNQTPMNDTYAMAIRSSEATALKVKSLSDVATLAASDPSKATFCVESEFSTRDDGLPGMLKAYGMTVPAGNLKMLDTGVIYTETAKGKTCNFGEVFTTDGRISALKLTVMKDDKHFFPNYNAALTMKQELLDKNPALATLLNPVAAQIDNDTMTKLNAEVDVQGEDADDVAKQWLTDKHLL